MSNEIQNPQRESRQHPNPNATQNPKPKPKRMWLVGALIVIAGIVLSAVLSQQKEPMKRRAEGPQAKPLKIITVKNGDITIPVEMTGPLYAYHKIELYAEVSGVLLDTSSHKPFKVGYTFNPGEILIQVDDRVYKNNLLAQKSNLLNQLTLMLPDLSMDFPGSTPRWEEYLKNLELEKPLPPLPAPASEKERYYIVSRNIYNLFYTIESMEATLAKYTLKAPFAGVVSQSSINPGTLVRQGQKLGEFTNTSLYEMEAAVSLFDANRLVSGQEVTLTTEDITGSFNATIQRINRVLDRSSMTVKVYIHTRSDQLRDGMYMRCTTSAAPIPNAFSVPKDLLLEGNQIYVVENSILRRHPISIIAERGGRLIAQGLPDGTLILGQVWDEAAEGKALPQSPNTRHTQEDNSTPVETSTTPAGSSSATRN